MTYKNIFMLFAAISLKLNADAPFITSDPTAVAYKSGETYYSSTGIINRNETTIYVPQIEIDYGIFPDIQLQLILSATLNKESDHAAYIGFGDTQIGLTFCFFHETACYPQISFIPVLIAPTGDEEKGTGNGNTRLFLPIWLQKKWDSWTFYGGGGYWFNPGKDNKNFWYTGWVLQKQISDSVWMGVENFYQSADSIYDPNIFGFNVGGGFGIDKNWEIIFSTGSTTNNQYLYYIGLHHTWDLR